MRRVGITGLSPASALLYTLSCFTAPQTLLHYCFQRDRMVPEGQMLFQDDKLIDQRTSHYEALPICGCIVEVLQHVKA